MIRYISQTQPVSLLLALLLWHGSAHAQAEGHSSQSIISSQIEELRGEVQQLRQLVEQQQRALLAMQKRTDEREVPSPAGAARAAPPANAHADTGTAAPRQAAASASNAAETPDQASPPAGFNGNRFFLRSPDGRFQSEIIGYSQLDFHGYQSGDHPPNTFLIRRARLGVEGRLERYFDYKVEGDFADTNSTLLRDLYGRIHRTDGFQLTFGQFRVPISQEEMRFDAVQDFVERSMVNSLVPSRSPGLMASGVLAKRVFEYQIGAFNGKGLLATNNNGTPESALRVRLSPWKNRKSVWGDGFSFGGAFTTGRNVGGLSVRGQTESRSFIFFMPETVNGKQTRANGELTWMLGPAAIRAEYDQTHQERRNLGADGTDLPGVVAQGYMAQVTYLLTGETKPEAGAVAPRFQLFREGGGRGGLGAWELKLRYANLNIADGSPKSNRAETLFFGVNWYMNRFMTHMVDFGFERFRDRLRTPRPGDDNFFVVLSRLQVTFSAR